MTQNMLDDSGREQERRPDRSVNGLGTPGDLSNRPNRHPSVIASFMFFVYSFVLLLKLRNLYITSLSIISVYLLFFLEENKPAPYYLEKAVYKSQQQYS